MPDRHEYLSRALAGDPLGEEPACLWGDPAAAYRASEYLTATPPRLVELLYDGATALCDQAVSALDAGDLEPAADRLGRARRIFRQLQCCIQPAEGREMQRLWEFCEEIHGRLIEAEHYRRREAVAEAISLLTFQRGDWCAAVRRASRQRRLVENSSPGDWVG
jgi:flagellin-specific chaperone FliS